MDRLSYFKDSNTKIGCFIRMGNRYRGSEDEGRSRPARVYEECLTTSLSQELVLQD
jgi:hypothetical protein